METLSLSAGVRQPGKHTARRVERVVVRGGLTGSGLVEQRECSSNHRLPRSQLRAPRQAGANLLAEAVFGIVEHGFPQFAVVRVLG